jgi:hypothetical protein
MKSFETGGGGLVVSNVISAVSNALYEEFGEQYRIYADNVEQNLTRPCFFINIVRPALMPHSIGRDKMSVPLIVQYFPSSVGKRRESYAVSDQLFRCLKYPEYNDVVFRGTDMKFDIDDDKLNFRVQYNFPTVVYDPTEVKPTIDDIDSTVTTNREDED